MDGTISLTPLATLNTEMPVAHPQTNMNARHADILSLPTDGTNDDDDGVSS